MRKKSFFVDEISSVTSDESNFYSYSNFISSLLGKKSKKHKKNYKTKKQFDTPDKNVFIKQLTEENSAIKEYKFTDEKPKEPKRNIEEYNIMRALTNHDNYLSMALISDGTLDDKLFDEENKLSDFNREFDLFIRDLGFDKNNFMYFIAPDATKCIKNLCTNLVDDGYTTCVKRDIFGEYKEIFEY